MAAPPMQSSPRGPKAGMDVVLRRMRSYRECSPSLAESVGSLDRIERLNANALLQSEGETSARPRYLLEGWACRYRDLTDGRRQIFDFVLPGEGLGVCLRPHLSAATTVALTPVVLADAAPLMTDAARALATEHAALVELAADADERRLLGALVRLGRMSALERLGHLLLELETRLGVVGLSSPDGFPMPATQETLADILGLSVVHINRTIQELRRQGVIALTRSHVHIRDRAALERLADA